jgi:hypothetical protein
MHTKGPNLLQIHKRISSTRLLRSAFLLRNVLQYPKEINHDNIHTQKLAIDLAKTQRYAMGVAGRARTADRDRLRFKPS